MLKRSGAASAGSRAGRAAAVAAAAGHGETAETGGETENGSAAANAHAEVQSGNLRDVEKSVFFKSFPRPAIIALRSSEVDMEAARVYALKARRFFAHPINLFNQHSVFYEESEGDYIEEIYGNAQQESVLASDGSEASGKLRSIDEEDRYYVGTLTRMRHTTNANTSTYFAKILPLALGIGFAPLFAVYIQHALQSDAFAGVSAFQDPAVLLAALGMAVGLIFAVFSYYVSYKNQQIRNTANFNGYVETRLNRINTIRTDALKEAANAEKEKTNEGEVLNSAVDWMLCYHWMIWRSFLNELGIRNILFQIRRNTDLYKWGGFLILFVLNAAFVAASFLLGLEIDESLTLSAASTAWLVVLPYFYIFHICADPAGLVEGKLYANDWARFHTSGIDRGLEDQIRRDKGEILHYRNRLKNEAL
ncbi:hypothetical protein [Hyphobacterium marinum]|uniref:Uncharacterized protein n=1 Tax=Hyphobacterium marinum TaxID=3116574 RepID=A0ABU7LZY8_9PROT|nr:hypothetical protein [Hyphobacterium sp. Y6023]MEE2567131.1 hypothetical protein [Hyphobacterium sp. Y6023]